MTLVAIQESTGRMLAGSIRSTICISLMRKLSPEYLRNLPEITGLMRGSVFKPSSDRGSPPAASCCLQRLLLNPSSLSLLGTAGHHWAPQTKGVDGSPGEGNSHGITHKEVDIESHGKLTAAYPGGCRRGNISSAHTSYVAASENPSRALRTAPTAASTREEVCGLTPERSLGAQAPALSPVLRH